MPATSCPNCRQSKLSQFYLIRSSLQTFNRKGRQPTTKEWKEIDKIVVNQGLREAIRAESSRGERWTYFEWMPNRDVGQNVPDHALVYFPDAHLIGIVTDAEDEDMAVKWGHAHSLAQGIQGFLLGNLRPADEPESEPSEEPPDMEHDPLSDGVGDVYPTRRTVPSTAITRKTIDTDPVGKNRWSR